MRGGTITNGGELDKDDFIIDDNFETYGSIVPCRLTRKQNRLQEPFIFFGKKIRGIYYQYVAFNEGIFRKTAKFNKLYISDKYSYQSNAYEPNYDLQDVQISEIPKEALEELKKFIEKKRNRTNNSFEKNTFCNTIYEAVNEELSLRKSNTDTRFFREINRIEDNEKKIRLIQQHKQGEYRQLLVSINIIKQKLNASPSYHGHSGWTQGYNQNDHDKGQFREELTTLLKQKEDIEKEFPASTN